MAGWERKNRFDFSLVPNGTDALAEAMTEGSEGHPFTKYAAWGRTTTGAVNKAETPGTPSTFTGLKPNSTDAKGAAALYGTATKLRAHSVAALGEKITSNTGAVLSGITVLAEDTNASGKGVFAGLSMAALGATRKWVIAVDTGAAALTPVAELAATSLGAGGKVARPYKVTLENGVVKLYTPDQVAPLEHDFTSQLGELGTWYGVRCRQPGSVTASESVVHDSVDFFVYSASYMPPNAIWEESVNRLIEKANAQVLVEFGPGSNYTKTGGATPTYDATDRLDPFAQSLVQTFNDGSSQRLEYAFGSTVDFTGKDLALVLKAVGPDQLVYSTTKLAKAATVPASGTFSLEVSTPSAVESFGTLDAPGGRLIGYKTKVGSVLGECELLNGEPGELAKEASVYQHGTGYVTPGNFTICLAENKAALEAGNYYLFKPVNFNLGTWQTATFLTAVGNELGPEARKEGTGCDLTKVGYVKLTYACSKLPFSGLGEAPNTVEAPLSYSGVQSSETPAIKWGGLLSFTHTAAPTVVFTFDDSHESDYTVVAPELEKARPGFPSGMRATFFDIVENLGSASFKTAAQAKELAEKGHEVSIHTRFKKAHGSQAVQGFFGWGPGEHYNLIKPGATAADALEAAEYLKSLGIKGPFTWAWAFGEPVGAGPTTTMREALVKAQRSTAGGGVTPITEGSGASIKVTGFNRSSISTRFLTEPPGQTNRVTADGFNKDVGGATAQGHKIVIRAILEACKLGAKYVTYSHNMGAGSEAPTFSGEWNQKMFGEVLDYISDLKQGTNAGGFNAALDHFPELKVQTLLEATAGETQRVGSEGGAPFPLSRRNRILT